MDTSRSAHKRDHHGLPRKAWPWLAATLAVIAATCVVFYWRPALFIPALRPERIHERAPAPSSFLLDRHGDLLYEISDPLSGSHREVPLDRVPTALQQAVIATEDASFYKNVGVDLRAIIRALWLNLRSGKIVSGGSTITQQVARNLLLSPKERYRQTAWRKAHESVLAFGLTRTYSKDQILALYLNHSYFGNMAYGVEAAAQAYYGKPVEQLDLAECAMLAGLPQAPAVYDPLTDLTTAKERQRTVLDLMVRAGYIEQELADLAYAETLRFASSSYSIEAPHFCMYVRQQLSEIVGKERLAQGGLVVTTTLDLPMQQAAERHMAHAMQELNEPTRGKQPHQIRNAAAIVLAPDSGAVATMLGSPDYFDAQIDGAVNAVLALRQPGSALKPFTYAAAFERSYSPATVLSDVEMAFTNREGELYVPINYDNKYHGPVSLRTALACSYNVVAVRLLDRIGVQALPDMVQRFGVQSLGDVGRHGLSLTLGGCEVRLLDLTAAYAGLAVGGKRVTPYVIERITDNRGHLLYQHQPTEQPQVLDERIAYLISDILSDDQARAPAFGEGSALHLPFAAAAKTGTTTDWRDNWTVGYSTRWACGVWVGNADNEPMEQVSGVTGAAPMWHAIMNSIHHEPPADFARPSGILEVDVCPLSGLLPNAACPHTQRDLFLAENLPREHCRMHQYVYVDPASGQVSAAPDSEGRLIRRRITRWPDELLDWAQQEGLTEEQREWLDISNYSVDNIDEVQISTGALAFISPYSGAQYALVSELDDRYQRLEIRVNCPAHLRDTHLELWIDDELWHTWEGAPYTVFWPLSVGQHRLALRAYRDADLVAENSLDIYVEEGKR